jgi:hypothetical protein
MQGDGNFVVYQMDPPCSSCLPPVQRTLFATNTQGHSGTFLAIQNDGNLVLYQGVGHSIWASNTGGG